MCEYNKITKTKFIISCNINIIAVLQISNININRLIYNNFSLRIKLLLNLVSHMFCAVGNVQTIIVPIYTSTIGWNNFLHMIFTLYNYIAVRTVFGVSKWPFGIKIALPYPQSHTVQLKFEI